MKRFLFFLMIIVGPVCFAKKNKNTKKIYEYNLESSCHEIAGTFFANRGFNIEHLPEHCKKKYRKKISKLLPPFKHGLKIARENGKGQKQYIPKDQAQKSQGH